MSRLEVSHVDFIYPKSDKIVLRDLCSEFESGSFSSIVGISGAGKSTLLYILSGFVKPSNGMLLYNDREVDDLKSYRRNVVSTISQSYLLFPTRTVIENVKYPLLLNKAEDTKAENRAKELLKSVSIDQSHFKKLPEKLSGGEKQRVAIARALAADSKIIVADEPTGNLDEANSLEIFKIFQNLAHKDKKIVIMVSHDKELASMADKMYELNNGKLIINKSSVPM